MKLNLGFDDFLTLKEKSGIKIFVFFLDNEYKELTDNPSGMLKHIQHELFCIRLNSEEFRMLDIGKHPKVLVYKNGKEIFSINGIPAYAEFLDKLGTYV